MKKSRLMEIIREVIEEELSIREASTAKPNKDKAKKDAERAKKFREQRLKGCTCKFTQGDNKKCRIHGYTD